jgi:uncharacterized repeat protein (TIGR01451 family)
MKHSPLTQKSTLFWSLVMAGLLLITLAGATQASGGLNYPTAATTHYLLSIKNNYFNTSSSLYIQNPGVSTADTQLVFSPALAQGSTITVTQSIPAHASLKLAAAQVPGLALGTMYNLKSTSSQPVETLVEESALTGDPLRNYRGTPSTGSQPQAQPPLKVAVYSQVFAPVYKSSSVNIWNLGAQTAVMSFYYFNQAGTPVDVEMRNVPPGGLVSLYGPAISPLPMDYIGMVQVQSDQPIAGLLGHTAPAPNNWYVDYASALSNQANHLYLPRALKGLDEGGGGRSTRLMVGNPGTANAAVTVNLLNSTGVSVYTTTSNLAPGGSHYIVLDDLVALPSGAAYAVVVTSNNPVVMGEFTNYNAQPSGFGAEAYEGDVPGVQVNLPRLLRQDTRYSIFSVQNTGSTPANVTTQYFSLDGGLIYSQALTLQPLQWQRQDLRQVPGLGPDFEGSAILTASQPIIAWVDDFLSSYPWWCTPVSDLQLTRIPQGDLFTGNLVHFTASAQGTVPFTYTWELNGSPVGGNAAIYEHTFTNPGDYNLGVAVENQCGMQATSLTFTVLPAPPTQPDLSTSYKSVSLSSVEQGDILTYTLVLRNTSPVTATATLTDPLPLHSAYMTGSAQASDGNPVVWDGSQLIWTGEVISGTPVLVRFAAQVLSASIGTVIANQASLADGVGHERVLQAQSVFNPGYGLSINDGALFTNDSIVDLRYSYSPNDPVAFFKISNDGGFGAGGSTTDWLAVNPADPTYPGWQLATYGDLRLPRSVYLKFRDAVGNQYGPFQDDIIYDPVLPQVVNIQILPVNARQALPGAGRQVIVQVSASDDNSGICAFQLSHTPDFAGLPGDPPCSAATSQPWLLQSSGVVYVRVFDRAGNASPVESGQAEPLFEIYMPMLTRD